MVRILGKQKVVDYYINAERNSKGELSKKPHLVEIVRDTKEIVLTDGDVPANATVIKYKGKDYNVLQWGFDDSHGDDGMPCVYTSYFEASASDDKKYAEEHLAELISEWNEQEIKKSKLMMKWCELHGKEPKDVCVEGLEELLGIGMWKPNSGVKVDAITLKTDGRFTITSGHTHSLGHSHSNC